MIQVKGYRRRRETRSIYLTHTKYMGARFKSRGTRVVPAAGGQGRRPPCSGRTACRRKCPCRLREWSLAVEASSGSRMKGWWGTCTGKGQTEAIRTALPDPAHTSLYVCMVLTTWMTGRAGQRYGMGRRKRSEHGHPSPCTMVSACYITVRDSRAHWLSESRTLLRRTRRRWCTSIKIP